MRSKAVSFESSLERDFLVVADFDPEVVQVLEQPVQIEYRDGAGRKRRYTPDFLVEHYFSLPMLYEIKYRADLWKNWPKLKPGFKAARRFAREHGIRFSILTEVELRGSGVLGNIRFLRGFRDRERNPEVEEHLVSTMAALGETTPQALLAASYQAMENRMKAIPSLWRMLANGRIHTDISLPLTMVSPIWVTSGEGFLWTDPHSYRSRSAR